MYPVQLPQQQGARRAPVAVQHAARLDGLVAAQLLLRVLHAALAAVGVRLLVLGAGAPEQGRQAVDRPRQLGHVAQHPVVLLPRFLRTNRTLTCRRALDRPHPSLAALPSTWWSFCVAVCACRRAFAMRAGSPHRGYYQGAGGCEGRLAADPQPPREFAGQSPAQGHACQVLWRTGRLELWEGGSAPAPRSASRPCAAPRAGRPGSAG